MIETLLTGLQDMSVWEYLAVLFGVLYLLLAMKQSLWCWPVGFISTGIYTILFWQGALLMESLLNVYYLVMAIYGWWSWRTLGNSGSQDENQIISWDAARHLKWISFGILLSLTIGALMTEHSQARFAYLDSFTTVFAVIATYLVTQKVLENWLYWIVIDVASIYLHFHAGYIPTAALFVVYSLLAVQGYWLWWKQSKQNVSNAKLATQVD